MTYAEWLVLKVHEVDVFKLLPIRELPFVPNYAVPIIRANLDLQFVEAVSQSAFWKKKGFGQALYLPAILPVEGDGGSLRYLTKRKPKRIFTVKGKFCPLEIAGLKRR
jgi:hypothetical protein